MILIKATSAAPYMFKMLLLPLLNNNLVFLLPQVEVLKRKLQLLRFSNYQRLLRAV